MAFAHYLALSEESREHQICENSMRTYEGYLRNYEKAMKRKFEIEPYPLGEKKVCACSMRKTEQGNTYQTLHLLMNTFPWFRRGNGLENFILSITFKSFKSSLRRVMLGGKMPN